MAENRVLMNIEGLSKRYSLRRSLLDALCRVPATQLVAVDNVSLSIERGTVLGIVGESGSGKTTLARCLIRLIEPDTGVISFSNKRIDIATAYELRQIRKDIQMVFQDPYTSLNPRMTIGDALTEAGKVHDTIGLSPENEYVSELLKLVGLAPSFASRRPRQLSGGQRQRAAIARALAVRPTMLIADEAVSALDVSIQGQILNLLRDLREELKLTIIFIAHQLSVISHVADEVAVMYLGQIVEHGATKDIFSNPKHPYTRALMAAHPHPDPRNRIIPEMKGEIPSPLALPRGCRFVNRCPHAAAVCSESAPDLQTFSNGHRVACHF
ncbi:MAG: peptide ABC transporter ATP-binding protein [Acidiferrobacteraceae bacterium]|nr:peptide ABC transporter ATP-binding protein [Acidiferrobacteraceae bacterium]|tara:strand:- start:396 stop:1373 length:978 start_codon:yes stop_codon:yes gene_type:complete